MYLFRISTERGSVWTRIKPKPIYVVAQSKDAAYILAREKIVSDLSIKSVSCLGTQVAASIFTGK
jgi:hypothetical protein